MAVSKNKAASSKAAPKAGSGSCAKCEADIKSLEKKVSELESKLAGLLAASDALDKVKSEVSELKEKAKSWKEKADTNDDGKLSLEEVWKYVQKQMRRRS